MYAHVITLPPPCLTHDVACFGTWAPPFLLHSFLYPSFWHKFMLVLTVQRIWFHIFIDVFLQSLILFLNVTSAFHLVVSHLYLHSWMRLLIASLWNWYTSLLQINLNLSEGFFFTQGNDAVISHCNFLPWSSRPFDIVELTRAFFLFKNVSHFWLSPSWSFTIWFHFCFFSLMRASFSCIDISVVFILRAVVKQLPNANSNSDLLSECFVSKDRGNLPVLATKVLVSQLSKYV